MRGCSRHSIMATLGEPHGRSPEAQQSVSQESIDRPVCGGTRCRKIRKGVNPEGRSRGGVLGFRNLGPCIFERHGSVEEECVG